MNDLFEVDTCSGIVFKSEKLVDKYLTEYIETIQDQFKTNNAKKCYKKQLKEMILNNPHTNSKKYQLFVYWMDARKIKNLQYELHQQKEQNKELLKQIDNKDNQITELERIIDNTKSLLKLEIPITTKQSEIVQATIVPENLTIKEKIKSFKKYLNQI